VPPRGPAAGPARRHGIGQGRGAAAPRPPGAGRGRRDRRGHPEPRPHPPDRQLPRDRRGVALRSLTAATKRPRTAANTCQPGPRREEVWGLERLRRWGRRVANAVRTLFLILIGAYASLPKGPRDPLYVTSP